MFKISVFDVGVKMTNLRLHPHLSGGNESTIKLIHHTSMHSFNVNFGSIFKVNSQNNGHFLKKKS